jgi:hypothetical protein
MVYVVHTYVIVRYREICEVYEDFEVYHLNYHILTFYKSVELRQKM